jgi:hypothetical protein
MRTAPKRERTLAVSPDRTASVSHNARNVKHFGDLSASAGERLTAPRFRGTAGSGNPKGVIG